MANEDIAKLKIEKPAGSMRRSGSRKKLIRLILIALVLILAGALYATGVLAPAVSVEVTTVSLVYPSQSITLLNASGYVVAQRKAAVSSKITSRLVSLLVEEGNRVKKGDVIARLEGADVQAAYEQALANLKVARFTLNQAEAELWDANLNFQRFKELVEKGYVAKADYDSAKARKDKAIAAKEAAEAGVNAAEAAARNSEVQKEYTLLRVPFDGVILTKNADVGDIITPLGAAANAQASVVTIADMGSLMVEADVSESNIEQVKVGQPCEIILDSIPQTRFPAEVHMIVPTADRTKATVLVKVRFLELDHRILPEMSARVAFLSRKVKPEEEKEVIAGNSSAIVNRSGQSVVFLVQQDRVVRTPVQLGRTFGEMRELLSGLRAGDKIVMKPSDELRNGTKIKVTGD